MRFLFPILILATATTAYAEPIKYHVFVGTYTGGKSQGIYQMELDTATGMLSEPKLAAKVTSPSFLSIHPNQKFLYAVGEVNQVAGKKGGGVYSFSLDPVSGKLGMLNQQSSEGAGPCHLVVDRAGKNVLVANYGGGSIAVLPIGTDGKLDSASCFIQHEGQSANKQRQEKPHAHSINVDKDNRFVAAADLGLDKVLLYRLDAANGKLSPAEMPFASVAPGSGPRHFAFHPGGKHAYVINELLMTVTAFAYNSDNGSLKEIQTISTIPDGVTGKNFSTAEVQVHPSGKFLYGSNRGHHSIAMYAIDPDSGKLTHLGNESTQGRTPRNFGIDPSGKFLIAANQDTEDLVVFRIDQTTGKLSATDQKVNVGRPVCVKFVAVP